MYHELPRVIMCCRKCGGTNYESVERGEGRDAYRFKRCLSCGHESERKATIPQPSPDTSSSSITCSMPNGPTTEKF